MRRRIAALAVIAAALAVALFGVPLAAAAARYYLADERAELERLADTAALTAAADLFAGRPVDSAVTAHEDAAVAVYGPGGQRLAGTGPDLLHPRHAAAGEVVEADEGGELVVVVGLSGSDGAAGYVRAASPRAELYLRTGLTWAAMAVLGAVAILGTWLVARWQARQLARPVERLADVAARLGEGDFTARPRPSGIPEVDAVGAELARSAERLNALLERERAFTADASHQLRTPLAGLRLQLEAALEDPGADLRGSVEAGVRTTDVLERTIDDLLALARDTPAASSTGEAGGVLAALVRDWGATIPSLTADVQPDAADAPVAAPALRQVTAVLLDNAHRHGLPPVRLTARTVGDTLAVDVTDRGPGPSPGTDPFRRRTRDTGGHGIGLALARRLAEAEGGRLTLMATSPTQFTLLLPLR